MKKVIVTGSRIYLNWHHVWEVLDDINPDLVIQGGANGVDTAAEDWAKRQQRDYHTFSARWRTSVGYIKSAGHVRNGRMLDAYHGVPVIAFPAGEAKGTRDCIQQALDRGHHVRVYDEEGNLTREYPSTEP